MEISNPSDYVLEERICSNGCERKFKVSPKSIQKYARSNCEQVCFGIKSVGTKIGRSTTAGYFGVMYNKGGGRKNRAPAIFDKKIKELIKSIETECEGLDHHKDFMAKMDISYFSCALDKLHKTVSSHFDLKNFCELVDIPEKELREIDAIRLKILPHLSEEKLRFYGYDTLKKASTKMRSAMTTEEAVDYLKKFYVCSVMGVKMAEYEVQLKEMRDYFCSGVDLDAFDRELMKKIHSSIKDISGKFRPWGQRIK